MILSLDLSIIQKKDNAVVILNKVERVLLDLMYSNFYFYM